MINISTQDVVEKLDSAIEAYKIELRRDVYSKDVRQVIRGSTSETLIYQKNHEERLKRIAGQNNGIIKVGLATDILYNDKILKSKSRIKAYNIVYKLLARMAEAEIFSRTGPAEFRLLSAPSGKPERN